LLSSLSLVTAMRVALSTMTWSPEIEAGLVGRLVLALEDTRDTRGETAERLVRRVHDGQRRSTSPPRTE
jgi:hypothetical protein